MGRGVTYIGFHPVSHKDTVKSVVSTPFLSQKETTVSTQSLHFLSSTIIGSKVGILFSVRLFYFDWSLVVSNVYLSPLRML